MSEPIELIPLTREEVKCLRELITRAAPLQMPLREFRRLEDIDYKLANAYLPLESRQ